MGMCAEYRDAVSRAMGMEWERLVLNVNACCAPPPWSGRRHPWRGSALTPYLHSDPHREPHLQERLMQG